MFFAAPKATAVDAAGRLFSSVSVRPVTHQTQLSTLWSPSSSQSKFGCFCLCWFFWPDCSSQLFREDGGGQQSDVELEVVSWSREEGGCGASVSQSPLPELLIAKARPVFLEPLGVQQT